MLLINPYRYAAAGGTPIALVANTAKYNGVPNGTTTAAIDTTGATLLVVAVGWWKGVSSNVTVSDSASNTWTQLTVYSGGDASVSIWYVTNPTTNASHTFTTLATDHYGSIAVAAFNNVANLVADGGTGAGSASATTQQPGSLTPSVNNSVVITALGVSVHSGTPTIDSGFTITNAGTDADNFGVGLAYKVQTTAGAENPTWTAGSGNIVAAITSFKHL